MESDTAVNKRYLIAAKIKICTFENSILILPPILAPLYETDFARQEFMGDRNEAASLLLIKFQGEPPE